MVCPASAQLKAMAFPRANSAAGRVPSTAGDITLITSQRSTVPPLHLVILIQAGDCKM